LNSLVCTTISNCPSFSSLVPTKSLVRVHAIRMSGLLGLKNLFL
jgi:hypothetical protein